jgi:hypothetical protein
VKIGGQTNCGIPSMRDHAKAMILGHPRDSPHFADPTNFGDVWLHDIKRTLTNPRLESLTPSQDLASGNRYTCGLTKKDKVL